MSWVVSWVVATIKNKYCAFEVVQHVASTRTTAEGCSVARICAHRRRRAAQTLAGISGVSGVSPGALAKAMIEVFAAVRDKFSPNDYPHYTVRTAAALQSEG